MTNKNKEKTKLLVIIAAAFLTACGADNDKPTTECRLDYTLDSQSDQESGYKTVTYKAVFNDTCRTLATQTSASGVSLSVNVSGGAGYGFLKTVEIDNGRSLSYTATSTSQISANSWVYNLDVKPGLESGYAYEWQLPWDISPKEFAAKIKFSYAADTEAKDLPKTVSLTIKSLAK